MTTTVRAEGCRISEFPGDRVLPSGGLRWVCRSRKSASVQCQKRNRYVEGGAGPEGRPAVPELPDKLRKTLRENDHVGFDACL